METTLRERRILGREVELSKLLGSGSNGNVFLATPANPSCASNQFPYPPRFVVKVMRKEVWPSGLAESVLKEVNAIRSLDHPFIVRYVGAWVEVGGGEHSGTVCLAMVYCDGGDLHNMICDYARRAEHVPGELVMMIMLQIFSALNHSHAHHVMHRDIKPANILLVRGEGDGGVAKALVGDYGLARPLEQTVELAKTRVGTPCYCSPEIVAGEVYTTKTDIFSAGVTFFELMTGRRPFWEKHYTEQQSFYAILHTDPMPRLRRIAGSHYDSVLVRVVEACLCKKESGRPTAFELLTSFASRLSNYVRGKNIPVYCEAGRVSPLRVEEKSPVRRMSPVSPVRRASPLAGGAVLRRKVTPKRSPVLDPTPVAPAEVKRCAVDAARGSPVRKAVGCGGITAELLLQVMEAHAESKAEHARLKELLQGDVEAFMLVQILLITRQHDRNSLENGIFKLLLSLKPHLSVEQVIHWMTGRHREA